MWRSFKFIGFENDSQEHSLIVFGDFGANLRLRRLGFCFLVSDSDDGEKIAISEQSLI